MDYVTLVGSTSTAGSIANWTNSSTVQAAAPTIVEEAESFIYRRLRHWKMQLEITGTMTIGSAIIALPSQSSTLFLEPKSLYITGTNFQKLTMKTEEEVKASYSYDGTGVRVNQQPQIFYFNSTGLQMDSPADQAYPYQLVYYSQLAPLSGTNTTNFLTDFYQRLVRCACMASASEFMKDSGQGNYDRTYWDQAALSEIDIAQRENDRAYRATEVGMILV